jgi:hypothetical protein
MNRSGTQSQPNEADTLHEQIVRALEVDQGHNDSAFGTGAVCGAIGYGIVLLIFYLLPALWLVWDTQSSWRMIISPAITLSGWTMVGAVVGGLLLRALSATLASSWRTLQGAVQGMATGYAVGAMVGAGYVFLRTVVSSGQTIDFVWIVHSVSVTISSIMIGSTFAVFGGLVGSVVAQPRTTLRSNDARSPSTEQSNSQSELQATADKNVTKARFQIGITRMLVLTAAIAAMIAIPAHILGRLLKIRQLGDNAIAFEVMMVAVVLLMSTFVTWAIIRGPTIYSRVTDAWLGWRELKTHRHELERLASRHE